MAAGAAAPEAVPQFAATEAARRARRDLVPEGAGAVQLLIGDAIGDAFGFLMEMADAPWIRANVRVADGWPQWSPGRAELMAERAGQPRGTYSDDCEMTVGLMKALVAEGSALDAAGMLRHWKAEWDLAKARPAPWPPGAEREGHGSVAKYFRGEQPLAELHEWQRPREDPGNAPPMRALPLAYVADADRERLCAACADATHPHPKARAAAYAMAEGARWLIVARGDQVRVLAEALNALRQSGLSEPSCEAQLAAADALPDWHSYGARFADMPDSVHELLCGPQPCPYATGPLEGMHGLWSDAVRTVAVVLYLLKWQRGPAELLQAAVDIGGDVDSVAALCLGVLGGSEGLRFGEEGGLPWVLLEGLEGVEYLVARAREFEAAFPMEAVVPQGQ
eukprot:TRINITY_DN28098_c0_g1_i1.p1 TRINITY_DN28098_c0_g1~~TRINITY_DN28098_c0_g1_i1.p1  ORF type:complete len:417 (+),score=89.40 TRINITY_DN28098_c0_g1_i1:70-1251(+)